MSSPDLFATEEHEESAGGTARVVADYLSAIAIFAGLISLAWHPLRVVPAAMLIALVAAGMSGRGRRLPLAAVLISAACFFLGMTIAIVTSRPLW